MSSVNIPFNLDSRQSSPQEQKLNETVITNFYSYQDPQVQNFQETNYQNEARIEPCFKKTLLMLIIALSSVTLAKSCAINCYKLSKNLALNFHLKDHEKDLKEYKSDIKAKIKAHKSFRGMKKMIKQEIKALDANEVLIRFEN